MPANTDVAFTFADKGVLPHAFTFDGSALSSGTLASATPRR